MNEPPVKGYLKGYNGNAEAEHPTDKGIDANGWTEVSDTYRAPVQATRAVVELHLQWAPGGSVEWANVAIAEVPAPAPRKVRLAAVHYRPSGKLAAARLAAEKPGQTLQPTALVHEAYVRLVGGPADHPWSGRAHFFGAAAEAMRRILVDAARRKKTDKHGGDRQRLKLDAEALVAPESDVDLVNLDAALSRLAELDPLKSKLVELRYFAGLTGVQAAAILGISASAADRLWVYTRAWLRRELGFGGES